MRRAGVAKTAAQFKKGKAAAANVGGDDDYDADKQKIRAHAANTPARQVVRVIFDKWQLQLQRWADYQSLFGLMAFIAVFLGVLYAQRGATTAYQVHSTIASIVVPGGTMLHSTDDIYSWLNGLMQSVWVDPTCGDGICEAPFEFAAFSRFGCKADCGQLSEIQNLTSAQVDVYWDFSHQEASLPASDLMDQTTWNLCPQDIQYSTACYDDPDNSFNTIAGSLTKPMPDLPDGHWALIVKKDIFQKTRGAVRDTVKLSQAAFWYKIYIAAAAAAAEQAYELQQLDIVMGYLNISMLDAAMAVWDVNNVADKDAFDMQQMRNGTCLCGTALTDLLKGTIGFSTAAAYTDPAGNCSDITVVGDRQYDAQGDATITYTSSPSQAQCNAIQDRLTSYRVMFNATVQRYVVDARLGNLKDTGKFGIRNTVSNSLRQFLSSNYPELINGIYLDPRGADAHVPAEARLDALMNLYVESDLYLVAGAPAHLALYRRRLNLDPNVSFNDYVTRISARTAEIAVQQANVSATVIQGPTGTATIAEVKAAFASAAANTTWLPASADLGPPAKIVYNLATWGGNVTAYMTCDLDIRGPEYLGTCQKMLVACVANPSDINPYNCTLLSDTSTVPGSLKNSSYREHCELPCDMQQECDVLCECWGTCGDESYCSCEACEQLHPDAASDNQFFTIKNAAAVAGAAQADIIASVSGGAMGRRLLQSSSDDNITAQLQAVLVKVGDLRSAQDSISGQMTSLQSQLDKANQLAEIRAASTRLADLIAGGRSEITTGQAVLSGKLDSLLQRQQAAIDAMAVANRQLAAIQSLSEKQASALADLDAATNDRLNAISVATQQGVINLYQALAVWKMARRDKALSNKITKLAASPCTYEPQSIEFSVNNSNNVETNTARERTLGLNNRVLAGLMLHTWRTQDVKCPETRFSKVESCCSGPIDISPYGLDAVFKLGSPIFNPDLYDPDGKMLTSIYNCSEISQPTFNIIEAATTLTVNAPPYCAELYNPRNIPYAFWHLPLSGLPAGFPVFFDINLSHEAAATWLQWVQEGLLVDDRTRGLAARLISYNADLKVFAAIQVDFDFQQGGSIKVSHRIYTLSLELYDATPANLARYAFEVLLAGCIVMLMVLQLKDIGASVLTQKGQRRGGLKAYFSSGSVWLKLVNNVLLLAGMGLWWTFVNQHAKQFSMNLRYPVYTDLQPQAYFLHLANDGTGLRDVWSAISQLEAGISVLNWYYALNGISILLLIARLLRAMDFQPRLGVVTRALKLAAPDLMHFFLVAGSVFICYCMMGFLIFGNSLPWFATFGSSINTCFEMLLGEFADVNAALRDLGGLQSVAGALFFWSFELLVFLILLNFLLAIIVDAFNEVKGSTKEQTGIHVELARLLLDKWHWLVGTWSRRYIGARKLDAIMQGWAGILEDEEAQEAAETAATAAAAASKHKGDDSDEEDEPKVLQVLGETVDEAALTQILVAVLQDGGNGSGKGGKGIKGDNEVDPGEVEAAAHFIIKRFGKSTRKVAEQALKELGPGGRELEEERDKLAAALERLAEVQRELAEAQRNLMAGQKQLGQQQSHLVGLITQHAAVGGNGGEAADDVNDSEA